MASVIRRFINRLVAPSVEQALRDVPGQRSVEQTMESAMSADLGSLLGKAAASPNLWQTNASSLRAHLQQAIAGWSIDSQTLMTATELEQAAAAAESAVLDRAGRSRFSPVAEPAPTGPHLYSNQWRPFGCRGCD